MDGWMDGWIDGLMKWFDGWKIWWYDGGAWWCDDDVVGGIGRTQTYPQAPYWLYYIRCLHPPKKPTGYSSFEATNQLSFAKLRRLAAPRRVLRRRIAAAVTVFLGRGRRCWATTTQAALDETRPHRAVLGFFGLKKKLSVWHMVKSRCFFLLLRLFES